MLTKAKLEEINDQEVIIDTAAPGSVNYNFGKSKNIIQPDVKNGFIMGTNYTGYNNVIGGDGTGTVGTTTPNEGSDGTNADVSVLGGYDDVAGSLSSKIIADHSYTEIYKSDGTTQSSGHNAIFGGSGHIAKGDAEWSMISGGKYNKTKAPFSHASGYYAYARNYGQRAMAAGRFYATNEDPGVERLGGQAQGSEIVLFKETTNATQTFLGLYSSFLYVLEYNQSIAFDALIVARDTAGNDSANFTVKGGMYRGASGASGVVGSPTIAPIGASAGAATWAVKSVAGNAAGQFVILITGETGKTIRWVGHIRIAEVMLDPA